MTWLDRLRATAEKATRGPWYTTDHGGTAGHCVYSLAVSPEERFDLLDVIKSEDAALIVAAVNSLPALLRVCEAAKALDTGIGHVTHFMAAEQVELSTALAALDEVKT